MSAVKVERTNEAVIIKLPLDTEPADIQNIINYFEYVNIAKKSKATQEQIEALAKEAKSGWWEKNKERFRGVEGFEDLIDE